jgi:hypothetical protein
MARFLALLAVLVACIGAAPIPPLRPAAPVDPTSDEAIVRGAGLAPDVDVLRRYFERQTPAAETTARLSSLVGQLGDRVYRNRQRATNALLAAGNLAIPYLRAALCEKDAEVVSRARACLDQLDTERQPALAGAAARLYVRFDPQQSAGVLLAYLPNADSELAADEVSAALTQIAGTPTEPHPTLVAALADPLPRKRAVAAQTLLPLDAPGLRERWQKLLADPATEVRLPVALYRVESAHDRQAVPVLIDLLAQLSWEDAWPVEEVLCRLAGTAAPVRPLQGTEQERRMLYAAAWRGWWQREGGLVKVAEVMTATQALGQTLYLEMSSPLNGGRLIELGLDGQPRLTIGDLRYPVDACTVGRDRYLVCEYSGNQVSERDHTGRVVWSYVVARPLGCQRFRNGRTFIATRTQLLEVDRAGREVYSLDTTALGVQAARKLPDGQIVVLTSNGECVWLDNKGRERRRFESSRSYRFVHLDVLPGGRVLIPEDRKDQVVEYDPVGKPLWTASVPGPVAVQRLPNGHTLVACRRPQQLVELDPSGKVVWEHKTDGTPWLVRRR